MLPQAGASDYASDPGLNHPLAGEKPGKDFRGRYPVLTRSMREGYVQSVNPGNVISYGTPTLGKFNHQVYWMVPVTFAPGRTSIYEQTRARHSYTRLSTDAYACVRNGRVEYWIYKESRSLIR
ncbi:hypothetical protein [Prosthecobacter sp.]|uniref:hypothetical protein n=1 Tax=Prosthecobacter sp. TaxID=1965333 RepID=UPI0037840659